MTFDVITRGLWKPSGVLTCINEVERLSWRLTNVSKDGWESQGNMGNFKLHSLILFFFFSFPSGIYLTTLWFIIWEIQVQNVSAFHWKIHCATHWTSDWSIPQTLSPDIPLQNSYSTLMMNMRQNQSKDESGWIKTSLKPVITPLSFMFRATALNSHD